MKNAIPEQLKNLDFRFVLLGSWNNWRNVATREIKKFSPEEYASVDKTLWKPLGKIPFEKNWQNNILRFDSSKLLAHINDGRNFGIVGGFGNLCIVDIDDSELGKFLERDFDTFAVQTGSGGKHFYFIVQDGIQNCVLSNKKGEIRAKNYQVVSAPCRHPSGNYYTILNDKPIRCVTSSFVLEILKPYLREAQPTVEIQNNGGKKQDTSRSGLEYRKVLALLRTGKTRDEIYKIMKAYSKWNGATEQYRSITFEKAENFYLKETENKIAQPTKIPEKYLKILQNPNLFNLIAEKELSKYIEGEEKTRKAIFLSMCSVWIDGTEIPLNTIVSAESSAGKSFICKKIIKFFPENLVEYRSKISPEAFSYWHTNESGWSWDGKICYLEDVTQALLDSSTFKVMASEGSVATIVKNQKAVDLFVNGKPVLLLTTARTNPNTEILNRFQIISLDETAKQTSQITLRIAVNSQGRVPESYSLDIKNSLKFLKRKKIIVPYATKIHTFMSQNYNFNSLRLRRDFSRLLDLIKSSAVLHQYQRSKENDCILANEQDYEISRQVINSIQSQSFKGLTHKLKKAFDCAQELKNFTAKDIHSKFPFVNQKMWYLYLDELTERGMLKTELRKVEDAKQRITFYDVNEGQNFELPKFYNLPEYITNVTTVTIDTNVTNVTKDNKKEGTIVTNVTNVIKNPDGKGDLDTEITEVLL